MCDRCFAWYLAVSEVMRTTLEHIFRTVSMTPPQLEFRRRLSKEILENTIGRYGNGGGSGVVLRLRMDLHEIITKPPFTGKWISNTRRWHKFKGQYKQSRCTECSKQTRTYCKCCKGIFLCAHCFAVHVLEEERSRRSKH